MASLMTTTALAEVAKYGIWTDTIMVDEARDIIVYDGIVGSYNDDVDRRIKAGRPKADISDYLEQENVELVKSILSSDKYNELFPLRNSIYTYDSFLQAVAKFPAFCGEENDDGDLKFSCTKELSALFANAADLTNKEDTNQEVALDY